MTKLVEYAPSLAIATVAIGLFGYAVALMLAAFFSGKDGSLGARLSAWFTAYPAQNLGIPCAAISAFAIVAVLLSAFPPLSDASASSHSRYSVSNSAGLQDRSPFG